MDALQGFGVLRRLILTIFANVLLAFMEERLLDVLTLPFSLTSPFTTLV